jgi:hypothetical protein
MRYRQVRVIATGQWADFLYASDVEEFRISEDSHRHDVAQSLGLLPDELETVESNEDLRTGILLSDPTKKKGLTPFEMLEEKLAREDLGLEELNEIARLRL